MYGILDIRYRYQYQVFNFRVLDISTALADIMPKNVTFVCQFLPMDSDND